MLAGLVPSERWEEDLFRASFLTSVASGIPGLGDGVHHVNFLVCVSVSMSKFPFLIKTPVVWVGAQPDALLPA